MFIADELNLSSVSNMNALAPALEMNLNHSIYFPGIENPINIHPNFFFVVCQNEIGTIGRNTLPLIKRFKEIFYQKILHKYVKKLIIVYINLEKKKF